MFFVPAVPEQTHQGFRAVLGVPHGHGAVLPGGDENGDSDEPRFVDADARFAAPADAFVFFTGSLRVEQRAERRCVHRRDPAVHAARHQNWRFVLQPTWGYGRDSAAKRAYPARHRADVPAKLGVTTPVVERRRFRFARV